MKIWSRAQSRKLTRATLRVQRLLVYFYHTDCLLVFGTMEQSVIQCISGCYKRDPALHRERHSSVQPPSQECILNNRLRKFLVHIFLPTLQRRHYWCCKLQSVYTIGMLIALGPILAFLHIINLREDCGVRRISFVHNRHAMAIFFCCVLHNKQCRV